MNYKLVYSSLMERARHRALSCYKESHHIIPKCMGGSDDKENIVDLTPEEHYLAHQLLVKIYPGHPGLSFAAMTMSQNSKNHKRQGNKLYGWLKRKHSENITKTQTGKVYYNNGDKCIKLFPGEPVPEGFIKGRGWSPTEGTTHTRKNSTFTRVNAELNKRRWDKDRAEMCSKFGVETLEEAKKLILDFKATCHERYWMKPTLSKWPFMSKLRLRTLID